jgi:hypothetical protein
MGIVIIRSLQSYYNKIATKIRVEFTQNGRDRETHMCVHAIFVLQKITLLNYPFPRQFFFPPYCIESFIHYSHFVTRLVTYIFQNNITYGNPERPNI